MAPDQYVRCLRSRPLVKPALPLKSLWIAHLLLFRGNGLAEWVGLVIVVQNISVPCSTRNGLPVITTSACGYAKHVSGADAGIVIQEPFHQRTFLAALETARDRNSSEHWSKSGTEYGKQKSLYEGKTKATELIIAKGLEATGSKKPSI